MQIGIIGVKFTGKTTLFNVITGAALSTGQGGVEPHRAVGQVPDARLDHLTRLYSPRRHVPAAIEWVDVPGFTAGVGADGAREAVRFLEHARRVDALVQVVRGFDAGYGTPDSVGEIQTLALELALADLQIVENRLERLRKEKRILGKLANPAEADLMARFATQLEADRPLRELDLNADEAKLAAGFSFLTLKPLITVLNLAEGQGVDNLVLAAALACGSEVVALCARMEEELTELSAEEAAEFLTELGIAEPASYRMIRAAYDALNLQSFFTVGEDECRAWTVRRGMLAPQAAGVIHSDLERGFIRAEVCAYADLEAAGEMAAAKQAHKVRLEGKNYVVQDGDILNIRFSV